MSDRFEKFAKMAKEEFGCTVVKSERESPETFETVYGGAEGIEEMIDFFYANKNLHERMSGRPDPILVNHFVEQHCRECGSQRCNPHDEEWLSGCSKWVEFIGKRSVLSDGNGTHEKD